MYSKDLEVAVISVKSVDLIVAVAGVCWWEEQSPFYTAANSVASHDILQAKPRFPRVIVASSPVGGNAPSMFHPIASFSPIEVADTPPTLRPRTAAASGRPASDSRGTDPRWPVREALVTCSCSCSWKSRAVYRSLSRFCAGGWRIRLQKADRRALCARRSVYNYPARTHHSAMHILHLTTLLVRTWQFIRSVLPVTDGVKRDNGLRCGNLMQCISRVDWP